MDESRFGLQTIQRRRLTLRGVKPLGPYQHRFANFYLYGAVCPLTGEGDFEVTRYMNQATFARFMQQLVARQPAFHHVCLLDNSATHHFTTHPAPDNLSLIYLPPYAPELNPIERVWQAAKAPLAWHNFHDLLTLQDAMETIFLNFSDEALASLTAAEYLMNIIAPTLPAAA